MNKMAKPISHHEALIYAMVTLSAADRTMTDRELMKIGDIVKTLPDLRAISTASGWSRRPRPAARSSRTRTASTRCSTIIAASLPPRLHETAYALAVEVAAADLHVEQEELRFLQMLRDRLDLDKLAVAAIERGARVRYRTL